MLSLHLDRMFFMDWFWRELNQLPANRNIQLQILAKMG